MQTSKTIRVKLANIRRPIGKADLREIYNQLFEDKTHEIRGRIDNCNKNSKNRKAVGRTELHVELLKLLIDNEIPVNKQIFNQTRNNGLFATKCLC